MWRITAWIVLSIALSRAEDNATSSASYATNESSFLALSDIPDPKDVALMARYIVHNSDWASVSYISYDNETKGLPLAAIFSISDGPRNRGLGLPYFFVSPLQAAVTDLTEKNDNCSLLMSLAQSSICRDDDIDPEDPRCAHVILTGRFRKISEDSDEYSVAKEAVFDRHPSFAYLPKSHHFFFAKLNITRIIVQDTFGGPSVVPVQDYFRVESKLRSFSKISLPSNSARRDLFSNSFYLSLLCSVNFLILSKFRKFK